MCAINGFNWEDQRLIDLMNQKTIHRGPDGTGVFVNEGISLGHNRLSIIDTRAVANQPMVSNNGKSTIVFNGEIYNFKELKEELSKSYDFKTTGDTEVILAAYEKWGYDCLSRFNGMFAFAIWDNLDRSLFVARDPVGIKPLYYYWENGKFIFSSEIKAILEHPIPRILDRFAFLCYMRILYTPSPYTMFRGINKLSPGQYIVLKEGRLNINSSKSYINNKSVGDPIKPSIVRNKIKEAVIRQLVSDRPLGIYLSGGMDSTSILDSVSRVQKNIKTFSVGFELDHDEQPEKFNQDLLLARKTAEFYKTDHHEVFVKKDEVVSLLKEAIYYLDEPISNATVVPMLKIARYAKQFVSVVLGGDGGDELLGGYERYRLSRISEYYTMLPSFFRSISNRFGGLNKLDSKKGIEQFVLFMFQKSDILCKVLKNGNEMSEDIKTFFNKELFSGLDKQSGPDMLMRADQKSWLVDESLMRSDKMSMAGGVEMRVPFLDIELMEYLNNIPTKYKVGLFKNKKILREAMKEYIPDFIIDAPKRGWFSPGAKWLRDQGVVNFAKRVFEKDYYPETSELFNLENVKVMLDSHIQKKGYHYNILWSVLFFQLWAKQYKIRLK